MSGWFRCLRKCRLQHFQLLSLNCRSRAASLRARVRVLRWLVLDLTISGFGVAVQGTWSVKTLVRGYILYSRYNLHSASSGTGSHIHLGPPSRLGFWSRPRYDCAVLVGRRPTANYYSSRACPDAAASANGVSWDRTPKNWILRRPHLPNRKTSANLQHITQLQQLSGINAGTGAIEGALF